MAYIWLRGEGNVDSMDIRLAEQRRNDVSVTRIHNEAPETFGFVTAEELRRVDEVLQKEGVRRYGLYGGSYSDGVLTELLRVEENPEAIEQLRNFLGDRHVVLLDLIAIVLANYQESVDAAQYA